MHAYSEWKRTLGEKIDPVEDEWFGKIYLEYRRMDEDTNPHHIQENIQVYVAFLVQRLRIRAKEIGFSFSKVCTLSGYFAQRKLVAEQEDLHHQLYRIQEQSRVLGITMAPLLPPYSSQQVLHYQAKIDVAREKRETLDRQLVKAKRVGCSIQDVSRFYRDATYRNKISIEIESREDIWKTWDDTELQISNVLGLSCAFAQERKLTFYAEGRSTHIRFLEEQVAFAKVVQQLFGTKVPTWVQAEITLPLCSDWIQSLYSRVAFDRKWRQELDQVQQQIHPKLHRALPPLPSLITQRDVNPLTAQFRTIKMGFQNRFWLWVQCLSPSY